jgi:N-acetylglucosaminyl-diphospho-decaprenol L-rhamnosyltransferase
VTSAHVRLKIVIVNFRTAGLAVDCLRSLAKERKTYAAFSVAVVENASGDGSVESISSAIDADDMRSWVMLLPLARNSGFAGGNNAAIKPLLGTPGMPEYILLLNPDTVVRPGALRALVEFMDEKRGVGIAGSRLENPDGTPQRSAFLFPSVWSEFNDGIHLRLVERLVPRSNLAPVVRDEAHRADWLAGASFIVRRELFERIGLMDDGYFMYYEEVDFCLRAWRAGWECWYVPDSRVVHLVGQASRINNPDMKPKRRPAYWFESRRRFFRKNYGRATMLIADVLFAVGYACFRIRRLATLTPVREPPWFFWDFIRFSLAGLALPKKQFQNRSAERDIPLPIAGPEIASKEPPASRGCVTP